jgi:hypothetical protein
MVEERKAAMDFLHLVVSLLNSWRLEQQLPRYIIGELRRHDISLLSKSSLDSILFISIYLQYL